MHVKGVWRAHDMTSPVERGFKGLKAYELWIWSISGSPPMSLPIVGSTQYPICPGAATPMRGVLASSP